MHPVYEEEIRTPLSPTVYFRVYMECVEVAYFPFKYRIPTPEITEVRIVEKIPWYVGRGLEPYPHNRSLYLVFRRRNLVEIRKDSGFWRRIILSVNNPEAFVEAVKRYSFRARTQ